MRLRNRIARKLYSALLIGVTLALSSAAIALETWDQEKVTALASQLETATKALKSTIRKDGNIRAGRRAGDPVMVRYSGAIDGIARGAQQLASKLAKGEGFEETLPVAKKLSSLVREAEVQGARIMTTHWMEEKLQPVEDLLNQLAPYYFED